MPEAATRCTERPAISSPATRIEPVMRPPGSAATSPMIAWQRVDLPMPLRPITATGSSPTENVASCTMCALPYHALRSSTASSGSGMVASEVEGLHELGGADLVGLALDDDR